MNERNRQLLVLAMTIALVMPVAMAQNAKSTGKAIGPTTAQEATPRLPPPALPPRATDRTEALLNVNAPQQLNPSEPPLPPEVEEAAMNAPKPPPVDSQGAAHAAGHSAIVQRDLWAQLDSNGDGRVSGTEGQVNSEFTADFDAMDADDDGYISAAEFRVHAKAEHQAEEDDDQDSRDD